MGRRRIGMFQYRQVLVRLRQGDSEREIARSRLMGRTDRDAERCLQSLSALVACAATMGVRQTALPHSAFAVLLQYRRGHNLVSL